MSIWSSSHGEIQERDGLINTVSPVDEVGLSIVDDMLRYGSGGKVSASFVYSKMPSYHNYQVASRV